MRRRPDGSYLVEGTVPVRELNREYEWDLPDEGATTIAGLVIQETGTIPEPGQRLRPAYSPKKRPATGYAVQCEVTSRRVRERIG